MVTTPGVNEADRPAPLEWRRHFYDRTDGAALLLAVIFGIIAAAAAGGATFAAASQSTHPSIVVAAVGGAMFAAGAAATMLGVSGAIRAKKNRVTTKDGATYIGARAALPLNVALALLWCGAIAVGIGLIGADRADVIQFSGSRYFGPFLVYFAATVIFSFWALAFMPMGRRLEFSPHGLAGQIGTYSIEIPWDSIVDLRIHRGPSASRPFGLGRRAEIELTTTGEADQDSYPIGLLTFDVDEDTLVNIILAARDHPEIRPLLGTAEGTVLFDGPALETRQAMSRSQVWLPWEQRIQDVLRNAAIAQHPGERPGPTPTSHHWRTHG